MAKIKNAGGLSGSQVIILNILAKSSVALTADTIAMLGKVPVNTQTIGPVFGENISNSPDSLRGRGLVVCEKDEEGEVTWSITTKGREIGLTMKGNRIGSETRVPNEIIDPVAIRFKKLRSYPFEEYTTEDMTAMRAALPKQYHTVPLDELRRQAQARRKQGIFSDPTERRDKALKRIIKEFGNDGIVIPGFLTEDQISSIYGMMGDIGSNED